MSQYRKKPVIIDAIHWNGIAFSIPIPEWFAEPWMNKTIDRDPEDKMKLKIKTLEGVMTADAGDWIIRGVKGEFYPCKPDIFEATYEAV